jgi:hypothetical protein
MDWDTKIEGHGEALLRIVALLFALAALADRASGRSFRVRCEVVSILGTAETIAGEFTIQEAWTSGTPILHFPDCAYDGVSAGDAVHLAARFRALAVILAYIWAQASPARPRSPRYVLGSGSAAHAARQIPRLRRGVGFRAQDSPFRSGG